MMEEGLRDIKPLLEIPDYSYVMFVVLSLFLLIVLLGLLYFFGKKIWKNRKINMQKVYFERLKSVDWNNTKKSAYEVTFFGRALATEPRVEEIYKQLLPMLEPYKYRKEVPMIDDETMKQYNLLVHIIDESI
jgi:hypothetical protein